MVSGHAGPEETRTVVAVCHRLARAYLRTTYVTNRALAGLTLEDQAMDAIADLFERSGQRFPVLEAYVTKSADAVRAMSHDEIVERLRPLVHGVVTDRMFESNGEVDASLSRLIRSVKRAVKQAPKGDLQRSMNTLHLTVVPRQDAGRIEHPSVTGRSRPTISVERLAARLAPAVRQGAQVPDLVAAAIDLLDAHPYYAPSVPVTALALAVRAAAVEVELSTAGPGKVGSGSPATPSRSVSHLVASDIERLIDETIASIRSKKRSYYVGQKNLAENLYASYFSAIRTYLEARYLPPADPALTQHEALRLHCPDITRDVYRENHRSTFEYLVRMVRDAFLETVQRVHVDLTES
jgi:hypothetical protein